MSQSRKEKERRGIHRIAELANVSIGTVDRALHGRNGINESTRQRILEVAAQIGYTPNLAARALSATKGEIRVGVCVPREIHFFYDQLWGGIVDECRRVSHLGIEFVNRPVQTLGEGDAEVLSQLLEEEKVDGVIVTAGNPRALTPLIDAAEANGTKVICVSTDAPSSRRSCIVCVDPWLNGCLAGELMGKFVPPDSKVAAVAGMLQAEDHRKKTDGFSDSFPRNCPGGRVVAVIEGNENEGESYQKTYDLLGQIPDLAGIYVNTVNCLPVCQALQDKQVAGKVKLIGTDLFSEMEPYFDQGIITASIYQQPYRQGQVAVRLMADLLASRVSPPRTVHLSPAVVMSSNLRLFREMRQPNVQLERDLEALAV